MPYVIMLQALPGFTTMSDGFCTLNRELAAIFIFFIASFAFLVPGFMLRLEDVRVYAVYAVCVVCVFV
jgi:hypothetical protein